MKLSVMMPAYNTKEEYLREAIESILNQTFEDFELIILNDGSTTNIEDVVLSYEDKRIKYYKNEKNMGLSYTRNRLLDLAKSEYAAIMDSDDIALPERFEKEINFLDNNPEVTVVGSLYETFPIIENVVKIKNPTYFDFLARNFIINSTVMFRRKAFDMMNIRYDANYDYVEDYDMWSKVIQYFKVVILQDVLLKYRAYPENVTNTNSKEGLKKVNIIQQNMMDFLTSDKKMQKQIARIVYNDKIYNITFLQKLFSVRNESNYKVFRVFGFKFLFKRRKR